MQTIQIIKVRTGNNEPKAVLGLLRELSADLEAVVPEMALRLYKYSPVAGDFTYLREWGIN